MELTEFNKRFIAARKAVISSEFNHLNEIQLKAVLKTQGPLLLLAGAGSGKTTVLINRIANLLRFGSGSDTDHIPEDADEDDLLLLESCVKSNIVGVGSMIAAPVMPDEHNKIQYLCSVDPVEPWRIMAITFTNKAAGEIKERLETMLGPEAEDIWAMTFHSACSRILRNDIERLGYNRSFTIYDTSDTASLMKRILRDFDIHENTLPHRTVLSYISRAKDIMQFAEDFYAQSEMSGDVRRSMIGRAYKEYESRMRASDALDFDDLILLTVRLFKENPDILQHYQKRFRYILIDEYQDTNNLQYLLASALAGGHGNICVVGDDDQSIYKFRGATIENILSFEKHFKNAQVIRLEQNYRSTGYILDAANEVIRNNKGRKGKNLWTENELGTKPELHITDNERSEAVLVADTLIKSVADGHNWQEHAVLYRMNAQSNQLETAFKRAGIPYRVLGGTSFYERAEIKDMLAYLCVIQNPNDDVRMFRIINNPPRGIGDTTVSRLTDVAIETQCTIYQAIDQAPYYENLRSSAARLRQFKDMIDDLRQAAQQLQLDELYDMLLDRTGYVRMLEEKDTNENLTRLENVRELKTNIISFIKENENTASLFDFLSETALYTDMDRDDHSTDRVSMMTMHSAKGLEFDTVFIVGAEEGIFPGTRAIGNPDEIEEERRLCYVGMTRAMRRLYFTAVRQRTLFGKTTAARSSRFVREISPEYLVTYDLHSSFASYNFEPSFGSDADSSSIRKEPPYSNSRSKNNKLGKQSKTNLSPSEKPEQTLPDLKKGDIIRHKAFGRGMITSAEPGGGDVLLEIAFDEIGTKRMLLNSTARFISKEA